MNVHEGAKYLSIADALKAHYGEGNAAARRILRDLPSDCRPSDRTALNWLNGYNTPRGDALINLMVVCDALFWFVCARANRVEHFQAVQRDAAVRAFLREVGS